jgi:hypothetical protein
MKSLPGMLLTSACEQSNKEIVHGQNVLKKGRFTIGENGHGMARTMISSAVL